jgi:hypothetical protein
MPLQASLPYIDTGAALPLPDCCFELTILQSSTRRKRVLQVNFRFHQN